MSNLTKADQELVTKHVEKAVRESAHQLKDLLDSGLLSRLAEAKLRIVRRQLNDNANLLQRLTQPSESVQLGSEPQSEPEPQLAITNAELVELKNAVQFLRNGLHASAQKLLENVVRRFG